jgi:beta-lactamase class A
MLQPTINFAISLSLGCLLIYSNSVLATENNIIETVQTIEERVGGRIGIAVFDMNTLRSLEYRSDERFPISSTFKPFACAAVLSRVDQGNESLGRAVEITKNDLVSYSPVTETHVGAVGMTIAELCEATITLSDNTAGNLILRSLNGPSGFTDYMRSIGDKETRLDRWETELNEATPNDLRDTTTPNAAAKALQTLIVGNALSEGSREQLTTWMENDKVADALFRSILPSNWRIADKTGAGGHGARSIIAAMWPPTGLPIIAAVYMTENKAEFSDRNAAIAEIGAAIVSEFGP